MYSCDGWLLAPGIGLPDPLPGHAWKELLPGIWGQVPSLSPAEVKTFSDLRDEMARRAAEREAEKERWAKAYETMHMPEAKRCECGVDKAGVGGLHSDWCPKKAADV
jgi:hypothetical protein